MNVFNLIVDTKYIATVDLDEVRLAYPKVVTLLEEARERADQAYTIGDQEEMAAASLELKAQILFLARLLGYIVL